MDMMNSLDLLNSEFEKLQNTIESITKNSEKMIPDIISLYYQVTMVQTFSKKLSSDIESIETSEQQKFLNKIDEIQKFITENFSKSLHPDILTVFIIPLAIHCQFVRGNIHKTVVYDIEIQFGSI